MRYAKRKVKLPPDLVAGSKVGVVGEGTDVITIDDVVWDGNELVDIVLDTGWREPLCKIYLLRGRNHENAMNDPTSWIDVAIGECDTCGKPFPDSCSYHSDDTKPGSMVCDACFQVEEQKARDAAGYHTLQVVFDLKIPNNADKSMVKKHINAILAGKHASLCTGNGRLVSDCVYSFVEATVPLSAQGISTQAGEPARLREALRSFRAAFKSIPEGYAEVKAKDVIRTDDLVWEPIQRKFLTTIPEFEGETADTFLMAVRRV